MGLVIQGGRVVVANSGGRVIDNNGHIVVVQFPHNRYVYEKEFVGEKVTRIPKVLPDWMKTKKQF